MPLLSVLIAVALVAPAPAAQFDKAEAWKHLEAQCRFGPRVPGTKAHLECRDYLLAEMKKSCDSVRTQEFTHKWSVDGKTLRFYNLIGEQNWKDAKVRVVLTAHWDSRPYADQEWDPESVKQPVMGANDGASGAAVLLELMRALKGNLKDVGVVYLLNDGEDLGPEIEEMLLGATFFVKNLPKPKPDYGILLDMIGDKDLKVPMEYYSLHRAGKLARAFYEHAAAVGHGATFPKNGGDWITDDHVPLNEAGIPTIDLIDFTYRPWHTTKDTVDKCSADSLGKIGSVLELWLLKSPPFKP